MNDKKNKYRPIASMLKRSGLVDQFIDASQFLVRISRLRNDDFYFW
jgi:hypothetical protein